MMAERRSAWRPITLWVAGLAWAVGASLASGAPRGQVTVPERSDSGEFDGTWWYDSASLQMALWIRTVDGVPELKLRYRNMASPEGFETNWDGGAAYDYRNSSAKFDIDVTKADPNLIEGGWIWDLESGSLTREDRARFRIYRAGDGLRLVMQFLEHTVHVNNAGNEYSQSSQEVWTFRKGSKRLVRWEELPF